jgi:hypothetical protein
VVVIRVKEKEKKGEDPAQTASYHVVLIRAQEKETKR